MQVHIYRRKDRGPVWQAQLYVGGKSPTTANRPSAK